MAYQRGEIVLVPFPFSDLSTTKVRPAIVISSAMYHQAEPDLLLAAITSNLSAAIGFTLSFGIEACALYARSPARHPHCRRAAPG